MPNPVETHSLKMVITPPFILRRSAFQPLQKLKSDLSQKSFIKSSTHAYVHVTQQSLNPSLFQREYKDKQWITTTPGVPPLISTNVPMIDNGNCTPRFIRATMYTIPSTKELANQVNIPLSKSIHKFQALHFWVRFSFYKWNFSNCSFARFCSPAFSRTSAG